MSISQFVRNLFTGPSEAQSIIYSINNSLTQAGMLDRPTLDDYSIESVEEKDGKVHLFFTRGGRVQSSDLEEFLIDHGYEPAALEVSATWTEPKQVRAVMIQHEIETGTEAEENDG